MSTSIRSSVQRIESLDSLRGLAALSVVIAHYIWIFSDSQNPIYETSQSLFHWLGRTPMYVFWAGHEAVLIFFMLSGFVLALVLQKGPLLGGYPPYALKRVIRLWVPYMAAILTAVLCITLTVQQGIPDFPRIGGWLLPVTLDTVLQHASFITTFKTNQLDMVIWYLVHEMRISIFFPLIMLAVLNLSARINIIVFGALGVLANVVWLNSESEVIKDWSETVHYAFLFVLGALLAVHRVKVGIWYDSLSRKYKWLLATFTLLSFVYAGRFFAAIGIVFPLANDWPSLPAITFILIVVLFSARVDKVMMKKPVLFLGHISYSLYLFHPIVLFSCIYILYDSINLLWIIMIAFPLTLLVSWVSFKWVEQPSMQFGRYLAAVVKSK